MKIKLFEEFVSISDYKEWKNYANLEFYKKMEEVFKSAKNHDKGFNRIYYDLPIDSSRFKVVVPTDLDDYLRWNNYPIVDYNKGICRDKDGRDIKIGKLLRREGEDRLLKSYANSKSDSLKDIKDLQVVISRHPYDIIGMSTNRGWTTCHDLHDKRYSGQHLYHIKYLLEKGCLIAYLIRKSDRNIKTPISRCLIREDFGSHPFYVDSNVYGTKVPEFTEFLKKWRTINLQGL